MATKKIGIVIALDGEKQFTQQVKNAQKEVGALKSELKALDAEYDGNANSMEYLKKKQEILTKQQVEYTQKLKAAQNGQEKAHSNLKEQTLRLEELKKSLASAEKKLTEFAEANGTGSKKYKEQEKSIENLRDAIERQDLVIGRQKGSISDWTKKINDADAEINKINRQISKNEQLIEEASRSYDGCAKSIDGFGKKTKEVTMVSREMKQTVLEGFGEAIGEKGFDVLLDGVELLKEAAVAAVDTMQELSIASSELAAKTGLSEASLKKYQSVMREIRGDNFGEDFSDVSSVMAEIIQIMGELDDSAMTDITEGAITLRDTFDMDVNESIRAADVMMKTMGVDAQHAFDLIVTGAQNGLNRSGELVDNITEYAQLWGQAGFSAEEMFSILENGLDSGAYNLDKVNDYVKELGISLTDGRIGENIESFSNGTKKLFEEWKNGEVSTKDVFFSVLNDLEQMENQQEALTLASEVWSSLGEDNAMQVITALNNVNNAYDNVQGAMDSLKETRFDNLQDALAGLGAAIEERVSGPLSVAAGVATGFVEGITDLINPEEVESSGLTGYVDDLSNANDELKTAISNRNAVVADSEGEAAKLEVLGNRLISLNEITNKSAGEKAELKSIVDQLGQSVPELAAAYDDETGSLKLTSEEIKGYIKSQKEALILNATLAANQELINTLVEAQTRYNEATNAAEASKTQIELYEEQLAALQKLADQYSEDAISTKEYESGLAGIAAQYEGMDGASFTKLHLFLQEALEEEQTGYNALTTEAEELNTVLTEGTEKVNANKESAEQLAASLLDLEESSEDAAKATEGTGSQAGIAADLIKAAAGAIVNAAEGVGEYADEIEAAMERATEAAQAGAEAQRAASQSVLDTYHGYVDEIKSDLQNKISLFDKFDTSDGGEDQTVESITANLESQITAYEEYAKNLETVRDHVGNEIAPEFMQYLESMGMEGANTLKHIIATFEDNEPEKVKAMSDKWVEAMNMSEGIAEVNAANKLAYEAAIGELGSSDADFADLSKAVETAAASAAEGWSTLPVDTRSVLEETINTAKECGVQIPEGLTEGILNGETTPESAIEQLNGVIQGSFDGLAEIAKELGVSIPEDLSEGISAGGQEAVDAYKDLIRRISSQAGTEFSSNIESTSGDAGTAAENVAQTAADSMAGTQGEFQTAGSEAAQSYITALTDAKSKAAQEGGALASVARNALASYQNSFYNTGYNISAGVADGIYAGQSKAVQAAANMARSALKAAKDELEIRSPSRKFRKEVGQNISESTAFGINDKASLTGKAAASMSNKVYTKATSWLTKYKKKQQVSLEDEKWYWQQVVDHTKKGTSAYNKAISKLAKVTFGDTGLSSDAATGAIEQIESNFGVSKKSNGKKKDAETYYSEIYSAAEKYLSNQQILNDWSLQQELAYWNSVKSNLKKGTQAWYDATAEINSLQNQIAENEARAAEEKLEAHVNVTDDILDKYKVYYKVSAKAEAEYWDIVRKQFKTGTDERIEADQKYYETLQESYDQRRKLDEEYANDSQKINDRLAESVRDLQDAYHEAVNSRKRDILSSMNLFESWDATGYDADTLIYNLKTQVAGLALWEEQLEELGKKGISDALMEELAAMGPDAAANIYSLNQMTAEQLDEYNKLWEQKNALALSQAVKDNESLLQDTNSEIADLKADAQAELDALNADYLAALQELNTGISTELKNIVNKAATIGEDAVSGLIASIGKAATSVETYNSTTKVVDSITAQLDVLKREGQIIGNDTLSSILAGLTDQSRISVAAQTAAHSIKQAMQEELAAQQSAMQELNMIGSGGITMLNNMTEQYGGIQNTVNVDNSSLLDAMNQVSFGIQALITLIANSQMVMDSGEVVAVLQPLLSEEDAASSIRINRGKI